MVLALLVVGGCGESAATRGVDADSTARTGANVDRVPADDPDGASSAAPRPRSGSPSVDAICDTINNSLRCARAVEAHRLPDAPRAERRGDTLLLALNAPDTVRLVDQGSERNADEVVLYSYQDHWTRAGYFVIQKQYYEGSEFLLVNDSTGRRTALPDRPLRAPGAQRFAVLSLDLVAGYGPNVLQVWEMEDGRPARVWETEPSQWGPRSGRWADSTTLRFVQHGYCDQLGGSGRGMCDREAVLRRANYEWHLETATDGG